MEFQSKIQLNLFSTMIGLIQKPGRVIILLKLGILFWYLKEWI